MSMMTCKVCDRLVDTDYDVDGTWDEAAPFGFTCSPCSDTLGYYDDDEED